MQAGYLNDLHNHWGWCIVTAMSITRPIAWSFAAKLLDDQNLKLEAWLAEQRGNHDSYETIARSLWVLTDEQIDVTGTTIANWVKSLESEKA